MNLENNTNCKVIQAINLLFSVCFSNTLNINFKIYMVLMTNPQHSTLRIHTQNSTLRIPYLNIWRLSVVYWLTVISLGQIHIVLKVHWHISRKKVFFLMKITYVFFYICWNSVRNLVYGSSLFKIIEYICVVMKYTLQDIILFKN